MDWGDPELRMGGCRILLGSPVGVMFLKNNVETDHLRQGIVSESIVRISAWEKDGVK